MVKRKDRGKITYTHFQSLDREACDEEWDPSLGNAARLSSLWSSFVGVNPQVTEIKRKEIERDEKNRHNSKGKASRKPCKLVNRMACRSE